MSVKEKGERGLEGGEEGVAMLTHDCVSTKPNTQTNRWRVYSVFSFSRPTEIWRVCRYDICGFCGSDMRYS